MNLSIFSFRLSTLWKDRTLLAVLLFLVLAGLTYSLVRERSGGEFLGRAGTQDYTAVAFWDAKASTVDGQANVVLLGDSRVLVDCSPEEMRPLLPGRRIVNFGFNGAGLGGDLLARAKDLLVTQGGSKVLVLGVTPHSLTEKAVVNEQYKEALRYSAIELLALKLLGKMLRPFRRYTLTELRQLVAGNIENPERLPVQQIFHPDGWVESDSPTPDPTYALESYRKQFAEHAVSPKVLDALFGSIAQFVKQGIIVVGFRPPVPLSMYLLENQCSGFDEEYFKKRFCAAGGVWLHFAADTFSSYDGSHLRAEDARVFSRKLAARLADYAF